jgi:hypothetical protein
MGDDAKKLVSRVERVLGGVHRVLFATVHPGEVPAHPPRNDRAGEQRHGEHDGRRRDGACGRAACLGVSRLEPTLFEVDERPDPIVQLATCGYYLAFELPPHLAKLGALGRFA